MTVYTSIGGNNADLIAHVAELYLPDGAQVADVTWGKGVFWRKMTTPRRLELWASDINDHGEEIAQTHPNVTGWATADFTALPYTDNHFDVLVLDPPYIHSPGQHITDSRYNNRATTKGMYHDDIMRLYQAGMKEAQRVVKGDGQVWVKCKDQVMSGRQQWAHIELFNAATDLGMYGRDLFVLTPTSRTSSNRWNRQLHARKNHSFLWVFDLPATNNT